MSRDLKKLLIAGVVFLFCFIAAIIVSTFCKHGGNTSPIDVNHIQAVIENEIAFADAQFNKLNEFNRREQADSLVFSAFAGMYREKHSGIFLFDSTGLTAWSNNRIPVPLQCSANQKSEKIIRLPDGWYLSVYRNSNRFNYLYLLLIKKEYSYNNEFLEENFNKLFGISSKNNLSLQPVDNSFTVNYEKKTLFYITNNEEPDNSEFSLAAILFVVSFLLLVIILLLLSHYLLSEGVHILLVLVALAADMLLLRFVMLYYSFPSALYQLHWFSPAYYAESFWLPSLGDLILNSVLLLVWTVFFCRRFTIARPIVFPRYARYLITLSISMCVFVLYFVLSQRIYSIIINSSVEISPGNILNFSAASVLLLLVMLILTLSVSAIIDNLLKELKRLILFRLLIISSLVMMVLVFVVNHFDVQQIPMAVSFWCLFVIMAWVRYYHEKYRWYSQILLLFMLSLFLSENITWLVQNKEMESRKVLANNLANERDVGAEFFLTQTDSNIQCDKRIEYFVMNGKTDSLYQYIHANYIKGYLNKYDLQVSVCRYTDSLLIQPDNTMVHCFTFFGEMLMNSGIPLPGTGFYFLDNHNGRISYVGIYELPFDHDSEIPPVQLFIELNSKVFSEGLGYPELLLDRKYAMKKTLKSYSYAKFNNGELVVKKGDYEYPLLMSLQPDSSDFRFETLNGFSHLYYFADNENVVVMSIAYIGFQQHLISFSYLFFVLFVAFSIFRLVQNLRQKSNAEQGSLKNKIQFSIVFVIVISMLFIGSISIYFIIQGYAERHNAMLRDKLQSVMVELEHKIGNEEIIDVADAEYITFLLIKFSNVFYTDINLFDLQGKLIASSRDDLFEKGLQGRFMHPMAFGQLRRNHSGTVIINERMGSVKYLSAYVPFRNFKNETIAYINLPYFSRQDELNDEITGFIMAFTNVFLILIILSVVVGIFIANQLTRPLAFLQDRIRSMDLSTKAEKIDYSRKDELGSLIREYNKKIDELAESAGMLAKSERESAWREMAKQIAHEIKNPLTPMKLSVQHLKQTYKLNDPDWEQTLNKVTQTIIEQIETLSAIAGEFSNFAQMPKAKMKQVDLVAKINSAVSLFEKTENHAHISFVYQTRGKAIIEADPEQLTRVFNNLLKNSIQAIPEQREGTIEIKLIEEITSYVFSISDNGTGIDVDMQPKIFQPNFTTKTSGMGLGLSMVKSIVDQMQGEIWYETIPGEGTVFYIKFIKTVL